MRIGLIVDGIGEVEALPGFFGRVDTPHQLLKPVPGRLQPLAVPDQTAILAASRCRALTRHSVERVAILMDLETRDDCPGTFATRLRDLIVRQLADDTPEVAVVIKDRTFENWLVADPASLRAMPRLFPEAGLVARAVHGDNADRLNALDLLRRASGRRGRYEKVRGAAAICRHLDPGRAALNSRSFRRLLRVLGDSRYADQSRLPNLES